MVALPRLVVAAPCTGAGKTTIATGLMAALRATELTVSGHKVGPDFIDPGYHALATGRPGRNLDPHLVGEQRIVPLLMHGAAGADIAVIEGVMGLYDGRVGTDGFASTAHVAALTRTPVVLVLDVSRQSRTAAAIAAGMVAFDTNLRIAGVVLNRSGSPRMVNEITSALEAAGLEVLGVVPRNDELAVPSRHLGLVPAAERDESAVMIAHLGAQIAEHVDLDALLAVARSAPSLDSEPWEARAEVRPGTGGGPPPVVAMAGGRAFTFRYPETEELLRAAGCDVVTFDPLTDPALPAGTAGIYLGGGFPEVFVGELGGNHALLADLREAVRGGVPTVAECAGLLYLADRLDGVPMAGLVPAQAAMTERLTLRYPDAVAPHDSLLARAGERVTGHEFHRTSTNPAGGPTAAWLIDGQPTGFATATLHASYLHVHWAGHPQLAQRFADAVHERARQTRLRIEGTPSPAGRAPVEDTEPRPRLSARKQPAARADAAQPTGGSATSPAPPRTASPAQPATGGRDTPVAEPLRHHGDVEATEGLLDFAVNVYPGPRPEWLDRALHAALLTADRYPDAQPARAAIAEHHERDLADVLPTSGGAEAFTLIARARSWRRPVVVHPQFTEPHAALEQAGHGVTTVLSRAEDGFALDPDAIPVDADLVVVGNPTNPTGVLHPTATIRALLRPGRLVVVDEAFMDAVGAAHTGSSELVGRNPTCAGWNPTGMSDSSHSVSGGVPASSPSLAEERLSGLVVIRSLTKHWSIPGIRAGYVVGDPEWVAALAAQQTPWSVSGPAIAATVACLDDQTADESLDRARNLAEWREVLEAGLRARQIEHVPSAAPFVLARPGAGVREALRDGGVAVRRADTFPGLDATWVRIAVRPPERTAMLFDALDRLGASAVGH